MKRFFITAIACLLMLTSLWGCTPAGNNTPGEDTTTPADAQTTPAPELNIPLFGANTSYTLIRAEECEKDIVSLAADLRIKLSEMTDANVKIDTDWLRKGTEADPEKPEILISNTNRPESNQVLESIGYFDYAIRMVGKKLVIAGHTTETLQAAIDYFLTNLIKVGEDGSIMFTKEYTYKSEVADLISSPQQLGDYTIVFDVSNDKARKQAKAMQELIKDSFGVEMNVASDRSSAVEKEILVGNTSRPESALLDELKGLEYRLCVQNGKIVIGGCSTAATGLAVETFISTFLSGKYSDTVKIPAKLEMSQTGKVTLAGGEDPALAEGADLRIMSFNILAELWDDKAKATLPGRDENVTAILLSYMPDVVGLQETTDMWYSLLEPQLKGIYEFASRTVPGGKTNYSTLMYNTQTTEFIEGGTTIFSVRNSVNMRNLTWGRFRRLSDGKEYIVTCTHWDITDEKRQVQWGENAKLINDLYKKYNLPIFSTGDYNSNEQDLFGKFLEATGMLDPKFESKTINNAGSTTHSLSSGRGSSELCIDHIACTPDTELLYYNVLLCKTALDASDHCPIYIDVKLK